MATWTFERSGYIAGVAYPLLLVAGWEMLESARPWPGDVETDLITNADLVDYYTGSTASRYSYLVLLAGIAALVWFVVALRNRFAAAANDSPGARAFGGLGLVSAFSLLGVVAMSAGLDRYDASAIDPATLQGFLGAETALDGLWIIAVGSMPFALAIAAYFGLRHRALPTSLGWLTAIAALPGLIGLIGWPAETTSEGTFGGLVWIGSLVFLAWALITGLTLSISDSRTARPIASPAAPISEPVDDGEVTMNREPALTPMAHSS